MCVCVCELCATNTAHCSAQTHTSIEVNYLKSFAADPLVSINSRVNNNCNNNDDDDDDDDYSNSKKTTTTRKDAKITIKQHTCMNLYNLIEVPPKIKDDENMRVRETRFLIIQFRRKRKIN